MERIDKEYTEDQLFVLQDIADEQRTAMEKEWDKDFFDEVNLFEEEEDCE